MNLFAIFIMKQHPENGATWCFSLSYVSNMLFGRRPNPPGFGNGRVAHDLGFTQIARKMTLMCAVQDELLVPSKICWAPKYIPSYYT